MEKQMLNVDLQLKVIVDPETNEIVDYKAVLNGIEKKLHKPKTVSKKAAAATIEGMNLERLDNKLVLSKELAEKIGADVGDKVDIIYVDVNGSQAPYIVQSESGNKLSKTYTIVCRGKKNDKLKAYGSKFTIEDCGDAGFKMVGDTAPTLPSTAAEAIKKEVDLGLDVTSNSNVTISDLDFNLD